MITGSWFDPRVYSDVFDCSRDDEIEEGDEDAWEESYSPSGNSTTASSTAPSTTRTTLMSSTVSTVNSTVTSVLSTSSSGIVFSYDPTTTASAASTIGGTLTCYTASTPTSTDGNYEISQALASEAAASFCNTLVEQGEILKPGVTTSVDPYFADNDRSNSPVFMSAQWNGTSDECPWFDFTATDGTHDTCVAQFSMIYDTCELSDVSENNNVLIKYTGATDTTLSGEDTQMTSGGLWESNCILWELEPAGAYAAPTSGFAVPTAISG